MALAKKETILRQRLLDALDSDTVLYLAHATYLKRMLGDHLSPEISDFIDGKPELFDKIKQITRQEWDAVSSVQIVVAIFSGAI